MTYSFKEYILYTTVSLTSKILILFPVRLVVFLGKVIGTFFFYLDSKHKSIAYGNLRIALGKEKTPLELRRILKKNFQNLGMNLAEALIIPKIDKCYVDKFMRIEGMEHLKNALEHKRGAIFLTIHMGSWEVHFAAAGIWGLPVYILVDEQQRNPLLDKFLNRLRQSKGIKILKIGSQVRRAIEVLKENKVIVLVADHGIKEGVAAEFFGRKTLTPTGAIRLALGLDTPILPVYIRRLNSVRHKVSILPALDLKKGQGSDKDLVDNLNLINRTFEACIKLYPEEYLWFYKRFKYNQDRKVLVLSDAKTGHLRQTEAVVSLLKETGKEKGLEVEVEQVTVQFKNKFSKVAQLAGLGLARKSFCQGCLWCLAHFLTPESFAKLRRGSWDIVVSSGSSLAGVNFVVSSENNAKSIVIMRPGVLSTKRFDLVIMPWHDKPLPRQNVLITQGALNPVSAVYLKEQSEKLKQSFGLQAGLSDFCIGFLIGGDTKRFSLDKEAVSGVIRQLKSQGKENNADILVTTSRRTSKETEELVKQEFSNYPNCKLLVIANEKNYPFIVGGIFGLSKIVVVSCESISMISEAASSGNYVIVFEQTQGLGKRHKRFLKNLSGNGYVYLSNPREIGNKIREIIRNRPPVRILNDSLKVKKALEKLV